MDLLLLRGPFPRMKDLYTVLTLLTQSYACNRYLQLKQAQIQCNSVPPFVLIYKHLNWLISLVHKKTTMQKKRKIS
ncbi:hypothetical protein JOB18_019902 [Solea senegalensis]|uniref:Uncharacterized protein n=1 Tax=Solea senegalensis TaxID=28829 RepID=A0AAV6R1J1_SOLSE|nr:hypothetical protein JOB18_019902 [Solea senegalensis]